MHDVALWQILATIGGALVVVDRVGAAAVHLGLVPTKVVHWWQRRWAERIAERKFQDERERKIDILVSEVTPNGGGSMKDVVTKLGKDFSTFAAESTADRAALRVSAAESTADRAAIRTLVNDLSARVEQSLHTDTK